MKQLLIDDVVYRVRYQSSYESAALWDLFISASPKIFQAIHVRVDNQVAQRIREHLYDLKHV